VGPAAGNRYGFGDIVVDRCGESRTGLENSDD
jgi:hypothetical protein